VVWWAVQRPSADVRRSGPVRMKPRRRGDYPSASRCAVRPPMKMNIRRRRHPRYRRSIVGQGQLLQVIVSGGAMNFGYRLRTLILGSARLLDR